VGIREESDRSRKLTTQLHLVHFPFTICLRGVVSVRRKPNISHLLTYNTVLTNQP